MLRPTLQAARAAIRPAARAAFVPRPASVILPARSIATSPIRQEKQAKPDQLSDWHAPTISYEQLKPKTQSPAPNTYLIDVREPEEVAQGIIPSAVNLPLSTIGSAFSLKSEEFQKQYGFPKPKHSDELTFYCRSGKRSSSASDVAARNGYTNVLNYKGSWLDWTAQEVGSVPQQ